jgi:hypothetical protein
MTRVLSVAAAHTMQKTARKIELMTPAAILLFVIDAGASGTILQNA